MMDEIIAKVEGEDAVKKESPPADQPAAGKANHIHIYMPYSMSLSVFFLCQF